MNTDPVLIDDDDDDVIMDPVVILKEDDVNMNNKKTVGVPAVETIDLEDETPTETNRVTTDNNTAKFASMQIKLKNTEDSFVNNLRNNRLMDKIVTRCLSMDSAGGMPRVIYKSLLPLYRDTENTFKQSELLRGLLKRTYKLLIRDPNHKFLHIKTLCEELKSGGLRKKVPFVTLATNLKNNNSEWKFKELTSSSREINQCKDQNQPLDKVYKRKKNARKRVSTIMRNANQSKTCTADKMKTNGISHKENADVIDLDDSETEDAEVDSSKNDDQNDIIIIEDSNKENNAEQASSSDDNMDYDLLIPKNHVVVLPIDSDVSHNPNEEKIKHLEVQMANYKAIIDKLEEVEVTSESSLSAYYQCSIYKRKVVEFYKKICEITGSPEDIVKRREIRLHVAEGHPPGPAKKLEQFLNSMIDHTGAVELPDFSDVVKCVVESNVSDKLGWSRERVVKEALALFRQCGQALRKRRQKREYRDLLSLVRDKGQTDDPADNDPILLAKLEENKLIAKIKEEEILERYVNLENNASLRGGGIAQTGDTVAFEAGKDTSGLDSESEQNITSPNNDTTTTINVPKTRESSRNNINLDLLLTHNTIVTSSSRDLDLCEMGDSSKSNDVINDNLDVTSTTSTTLNPVPLKLEKAPQNLENKPLDIQTMLDELGSNFVCQVFDIEDPFLVIEISSDGFTDDDEL